LLDLVTKAVTTVTGPDAINKYVINTLVERARNRPHPWSTRDDYISWSGLTDRGYNARLLPAAGPPADAAEALGTARPPIKDVLKLFAADPAGQRACPKSTLLFPAFAQYLTDGFIRTVLANDPPFGDGKEDRRRTTSNHEIDLSPLYGRTEAQTNALRARSNKKGEKGRLKAQQLPDGEFSPLLMEQDGKTVKAEFKELDLPLGISKSNATHTLFAVGGDRVNAAPQVAMINTLLLREHNRLAAMLEKNNPQWDDERVFQIARNILIVMFIKIVVEEYINHINTSVISLRSDPSVAWEENWNRPNWITVEFSLLYRWHSLVPQTVTWGGAQIDGLSLLLDNSRLLDSGLASAFVEVSSNNATELGLGNTATFLLGPEEKAIGQARSNRLASYNAYRKAMDLETAASFAGITGTGGTPSEKKRRAKLAAQLKTLYGTVDNVEFYVGLFAEPREPNGPLPELIMAMVAMDAFSQALTNPLLSQHVWGDPKNRELAFTADGLIAITETKRLAHILARNTKDLGGRFVGMTRRDWKRE
jgi:prostaglandin-endoperoxide synthase 2